MLQPQKRPRGRPPKPEADRKRGNFTMRLRDATRYRLEAAASRNQRSLSEECEARVERSFHEEELSAALGGDEIRDLGYTLMAAFGSAGTMHSAGLGRSTDPAAWTKDPEVYFAAMLNVIDALAAMHPEHKLSNLEMQAIFSRLASRNKRVEVEGKSWQ
jgi:hypothetical protein